jgi:hypothetical protein
MPIIFLLNHAVNLSETPNISYRWIYLIKLLVKYDIVLCTLTLHHFKEREIFDIISVFNANAALELLLMIYKEVCHLSIISSVMFVFQLNAMSMRMVWFLF